MSFYPEQWPPAANTGYEGAGAAGAQSWDHQTPPTRSGMHQPRRRLHLFLRLTRCSGASSTNPREEPTAFFHQFQGTFPLPPGPKYKPPDLSLSGTLQGMSISRRCPEWFGHPRRQKAGLTGYTEVDKAWSEMIKSGKTAGMGMPPGGRREFQPFYPPGPARAYPYSDFGECSFDTLLECRQ